MLVECFKKLEDAILSSAVSYYGERLVSLVVYGSAARGTQRFDSDIDLLVIARNLPNGRMKRVREFDVVEERLAPLMKGLHAEGISPHISVVIKSPEEAQIGSPIFLDMTEDAKILFDKEGFFDGVLERLRRRLRELGARRVWRGNVWYWELKPDYRPGEVFEL